MGIYSYRQCTVWDAQRNKETCVYAQDQCRVDTGQMWEQRKPDSAENLITHFRELFYKRQDLYRWGNHSCKSAYYRDKVGLQ